MQNMEKRCANCFESYEEELEMCPHCGYVEGDAPKEPYALAQGMLLNNRYRIGKVIGIGGFGITYKAWDEKLETVVAIKEYYPSGLVNRIPGTKEVTLYAVNRKNIFDHGLVRFLDEARNMAKFNSHKNIVNVYEYFEENGTAYIAMEFLDGMALDQYLEENTLSLDESLEIIFAVGNALKEIHKLGIVHRDIAPDNIFMCKNKVVKLLDFGAARFSQDEDKLLTIILKPGFAPAEQYEKVNKQGPWTDVYALGATLYLMLTGQKPEESTDRKTKDTTLPPRELNPQIPEYISNSVMKAMAIDVHMRFQTVEEFEAGLTQKKKVLELKVERRRRKFRRNMGVLLAVGVVAVGAGYFWMNWNEQKEEETLPEAEIALWYQLTGDEDYDAAKQEAYEKIVNAFMESFPAVTVHISSYPMEEYYVKLEEAIANGTSPNLFESNEAAENILEGTYDLSFLEKTEEVAASYFLDQYETLFPEKNQIPLGFILPAVYVNNTLTENKVENISQADQITAEIEDGIEIAALLGDWEGAYAEMLGTSYMEEQFFAEPTDFLEGKAVYYLADTAEFLKVQASLPARYTMMPLHTDEVSGKFSHLFSMFSSTKDEDKAAKRLLRYLLSENSQDYLHIRGNSHELPINRNTLEVLEQVYSEYDGFFENLEDVVFSN